MNRLLVIGYWLLVAGWLWVATAAHAQTTSLTLAAYWALVDETAVAFAQSPSETEREGLASQWAAVTAVELPDGRLLPLNHAPFAAQLRTAEPAQLRAQLATLQAQRADWPTAAWPAEAAEQAQQTLQQLLNQPPFNTPSEQPNRFEAAWNRYWERVLFYLNQWLPRGMGGGSLWGVLWGILAAVALFFVGRLILRTLAADFVTEADFETDQETGQPLTAKAAWQQAQTQAQGGDYRTAVRYLYLSTLLSLEERHLLRYDRSLTNREYLRSVAHKPHLFTLLRDVVDVFDRVWYGYQPIDEATYQTYAVRVADLQKVRDEGS